MTTSEQEDGGRVEDLFRKAAFNWAQSTKRLVESSNALGVNTRVAYAALADIRHAKDMLDSLFVPSAAKVPANFADQETNVTATDVKDTVAGLARRIATAPFEPRKTPFNSRVEPRVPSVASQVQALVDDTVGAPPIVRMKPLDPDDLGTAGVWVEPLIQKVEEPAPGWATKDSVVASERPPSAEKALVHLHQVNDLSAPVYPKNGKALWAGIDCPSCPAKATERCKKDDGTYLPKPHTKRKTMAEKAAASPEPAIDDSELKIWTT